MSIATFDIQQFDGHINFGMWRVHMMAVLMQQGVRVALDDKDKKPITMKDSKWKEADKWFFLLFSCAL